MAALQRRCVLLAGLACAGPSRALDEDPLEYQVKAAFVCRFGNYVEWPPRSLGGRAQPFRLGLLGSDAVLDELRRRAAGRSVAGRPIEVRPLQGPELPGGLHAVFVTRAMSSQAAAVVAAARHRPVLTITELDDSAAGGIINFVIVDDRVRFDIQLPAAQHSGLKVSARLLAVARRVEGKG